MVGGANFGVPTVLSVAMEGWLGSSDVKSFQTFCYLVLAAEFCRSLLRPERLPWGSRCFDKLGREPGFTWLSPCTRTFGVTFWIRGESKHI